MHVTDLCPTHELLLVVCGLLLQVMRHVVSSRKLHQSCIRMGIICTSLLAWKPKTVKCHNIQMFNILGPAVIILVHSRGY